MQTGITSSAPKGRPRGCPSFMAAIQKVPQERRNSAALCILVSLLPEKRLQENLHGAPPYIPFVIPGACIQQNPDPPEVSFPHDIPQMAKSRLLPLSCGQKKQAESFIKGSFVFQQGASYRSTVHIPLPEHRPHLRRPGRPGHRAGRRSHHSWPRYQKLWYFLQAANSSSVIRSISSKLSLAAV